jgi:hypothetical protein
MASRRDYAMWSPSACRAAPGHVIWAPSQSADLRSVERRRLVRRSLLRGHPRRRRPGRPSVDRSRPSEHTHHISTQNSRQRPGLDTPFILCHAVDVKCAAVLCTTVVLGMTACGTSLAYACVTVPQTIPSNRLITGGTKLTVPVGAIVYVVLVEPENDAGGPGFPWLTPTSSNRRVLAPVHLCKRTGSSSLPNTVTGFRARRHGKASVTARIARPWRALKTRPRPARAAVRVR